MVVLNISILFSSGKNNITNEYSEWVKYMYWNEWKSILELNYSEKKISEFPNWSLTHDLPEYL